MYSTTFCSDVVMKHCQSSVQPEELSRGLCVFVLDLLPHSRCPVDLVQQRHCCSLKVHVNTLIVTKWGRDATGWQQLLVQWSHLQPISCWATTNVCACACVCVLSVEDHVTCGRTGSPDIHHLRPATFRLRGLCSGLWRPPTWSCFTR